MLGVSGRLMLRALVAGERDPEVLAELAKGRLRKKVPELREAPARAVPGLLIGLCLEHTADLEASVEKLDERVDALFAANESEAGVPFERARDHLDTITGVGKRAAETIIAEIGVDMSRFPTAGHLASWAGMAPGNNITGGKRRSGKTTKGDVWLSEMLVQCAWSAARSATPTCRRSSGAWPGAAVRWVGSHTVRPAYSRSTWRAWRPALRSAVARLPERSQRVLGAPNL